MKSTFLAFFTNALFLKSLTNSLSPSTFIFSLVSKLPNSIASSISPHIVSHTSILPMWLSHSDNTSTPCSAPNSSKLFLTPVFGTLSEAITACPLSVLLSKSKENPTPPPRKLSFKCIDFLPHFGSYFPLFSLSKTIATAVFPTKLSYFPAILFENLIEPIGVPCPSFAFLFIYSLLKFIRSAIDFRLTSPFFPSFNLSSAPLAKATGSILTSCFCISSSRTRLNRFLTDLLTPLSFFFSSCALSQRNSTSKYSRSNSALRIPLSCTKSIVESVFSSL